MPWPYSPSANPPDMTQMSRLGKISHLLATRKLHHKQSGSLRSELESIYPKIHFALNVGSPSLEHWCGPYDTLKHNGVCVLPRRRKSFTWAKSIYLCSHLKLRVSIKKEPMGNINYYSVVTFCNLYSGCFCSAALGKQLCCSGVIPPTLCFPPGPTCAWHYLENWLTGCSLLPGH